MLNPLGVKLAAYFERVSSNVDSFYTHKNQNIKHIRLSKLEYNRKTFYKQYGGNNMPSCQETGK